MTTTTACARGCITPRRHSIALAAQEAAQGVLDGIEAEGDITTPTLGEFLDVLDPPHDWVIPDLLERGDRLILTGSEGLGKSVLFRQLGLATAAGSHPFTGAQMLPQRVLIVDLNVTVETVRRLLERRVAS